MNRETASELIHHLDDGDLCVGHAPKNVKDWLETLNLPMDFLRFLQWDWPQKDCGIGPITIYSSSELQTQDGLDLLISYKLFPLGWGPNGDKFVANYSVESCPVGFITHEEYCGDGDPRPFFQPAARSLESFLYRISEGRYFPCDYHATKHMNDFLTAEGIHESYPPYKLKA